MASPYSARYYEGLRDDSERSARAVVPRILGLFPAARSVVGGVPGRVLKDRAEVHAAQEATRAALADIARKTARAASGP